VHEVLQRLEVDRLVVSHPRGGTRVPSGVDINKRDGLAPCRGARVGRAPRTQVHSACQVSARLLLELVALAVQRTPDPRHGFGRRPQFSRRNTGALQHRKLVDQGLDGHERTNVLNETRLVDRASCFSRGEGLAQGYGVL
jgi:hypothetical protein